MNVALFKTNFLGDNVIFLPVVQELRRRFPTWQITLVTSPQVEPLYRQTIAPEALLFIPPTEMQSLWRQPARFAALCRSLRQKHFDASLISQDQRSAAYALAWLAGGRLRVGGMPVPARLQSALTHRVVWQPGWSIAQWNWEMARELVHLLGQRDWPASPPAPDLSHLTAGVARSPRRVVIHAGSKWTYTQWPRERFLTLAERLAKDFEVVWVQASSAQPDVMPSAVQVGPDLRAGRQDASMLTARPEVGPHLSQGMVPPDVTLVETRDVAELARLLASAGLFVGNNSGPMHVANAVGARLVVPTGPTDFTWDPAWHTSKARVLRRRDLPCQPCDRIDFAPGECRNLSEPLACLRHWRVDDVERVCREQLAAAQAEKESGA